MYRQTASCLSIHQLFRSLSCFHILAIVSAAAVNIDLNGLFGSLVLITYCIYLGVESLGLMVIL